MFLIDHLQKETGMSLIEVIVSIVLLSIVLIPIINYFSSSTKFIHRIKLKTQALNLAQAKLEELRATEFDDLGNSIEEYDDIDGYSNFKREVSIEPYNGQSTIKKVIVTVSWKNNVGEPLALQTLIAER